MNKKTTEQEGEVEHESFGFMRLDKIQCRDSRLFGSDIKHNTQLVLTIGRSKYVRQLHYDHHIPINGEDIVEVGVSGTQLFELLTTTGGMGIPCTLKRARVGGEYRKLSSPPALGGQQTYIDEFKKDLEEVGRKFDAVLAKAKEIEAKKAPSKGEREELRRDIQMLRQDIENNLPFVYEQYIAKVERVAAEAKSEIMATLPAGAGKPQQNFISLIDKNEEAE